MQHLNDISFVMAWIKENKANKCTSWKQSVIGCEMAVDKKSWVLFFRHIAFI